MSNNKIKDLIFCTILFLVIIFIISASINGNTTYKKNKEYVTCMEVGGSVEQCEKIVYPELWKESEALREKMRNKLKSH